MPATRRALLSVSDKRGLAAFARKLVAQDFELLSTGGTAKLLRESGVPVTQVSDYTGAPEILEGRVKTLHPKIAGGILARPTDAHRAELTRHQIPEIDLVAVNLYPFREAVARGLPLAEVIEEIDIGGPTLLRAAAKNYERVAVLCDPDDYDRVADALAAGGLSEALRLELAQKVFTHTAAYDAAISAYLSQKAPAEEKFPKTVALSGRRKLVLRYGENPHQKGALYEDPEGGPSLVASPPLQGKELSFTNLLDLDGALAAVREFDEPACVAVKHTTPCGVAVGGDCREAFARAREADPVSIFGGVVALNRPVDRALAEELASLFLEAVVAPAFDEGARSALAAKKNLRLIECGPLDVRGAAFDIRRVAGGFLLQERDYALASPRGAKVVTRRAPTEAEYAALELAWRAVKHVKSNAIVLASPTSTLGIGAGQMSRVDSARLAVAKAREFKKELAGSAAGSDAFFPFRDGLDELARAGVRAVAQPGGSVRDEEVIAAADEQGVAMVFVGERHFRH